MVRASLLVLLLVACGKSGSKPRSDETPPATAPAPAAAESPIEPPPAQHDTGAIGPAAMAFDRDAAKGWLDLRETADTLKPPPADLESAVAVLVRWSASPAPIRWSCEPTPELGPIMDLMRFSLALATAPNDPRLEAVAKLSRALRQSDTSALSIAIGLDGAVRLAEWFDKRGEKMPVELRRFDPEPDAPRRSAKAEARCALWRIDHAPVPEPDATPAEYQQARIQAGLPRGGDRAAEMPALRAFVRATYDQLAAATTNDDARAILERRAGEATSHASSLYVRTVGAPMPMSSAIEKLEKYRALVSR